MHKISHAPLVNFRYPGNPAGLRFVEGAPEGSGSASQSSGATPSEAPAKTGGEPASELGEGGIKALQSERKAREALEKQVKDLQGYKGQMDALADAFGVKGSKGEDHETVVKNLQEQMQTLQRSNLVSQIAIEHGVTDKDDLALIADASSEEGMRRIAARIQAGTESQPSTPKPDRSQGGRGGEGSKPEAKPGMSRLTQGVTEALTKS